MRLKRREGKGWEGAGNSPNPSSEMKESSPGVTPASLPLRWTGDHHSPGLQVGLAEGQGRDWQREQGRDWQRGQGRNTVWDAEADIRTRDTDTGTDGAE